MKIIFSGLTRDISKEFGIIDNKQGHALYYNKAIYRFIYTISNKADIDRALNDFKLLKFENCDYEETDGGENKSIRFFIEEKEIETGSSSFFEGNGDLETISIDYEYDWLHSLTLETNNKSLSVDCSSYSDFEITNVGKEILEILSC
jgi:hypothetical protein